MCKSLFCLVHAVNGEKHSWTARNKMTARMVILSPPASLSLIRSGRGLIDHGMPVHQLLCYLPPLQPCLDLHGNPAPLAPAFEKSGHSGLPALPCQGRDADKRGPVMTDNGSLRPCLKGTRVRLSLNQPDVFRGLLRERIPSLQP